MGCPIGMCGFRLLGKSSGQQLGNLRNSYRGQFCKLHHPKGIVSNIRFLLHDVNSFFCKTIPIGSVWAVCQADALILTQW